MKVKIAQSSLAKPVASLVKAIGTAPSMTGVLLTATEGTFTMQVTNGLASTKYSCAAYVEEEGQAVVSAITLASLVKAMPDTAVTLETQDMAVVVKYGRSKARLNGLDPSGFPAFLDNEPTVTASVESAKFKKMTTIVCKTTYKDVDKPAWRGVLVTVGNGRLRMDALDGYRVVEMETDCKCSGNASANVPPDALRAVLGTLGEDVSLGFSDSRLTISSGNATTVSNLMSAEYPNVGLILKHDVTDSANVVTEEIAEALQRVDAMTKEDHRVTFSGCGGEMLFRGVSRMEGEIREQVPMDYKGELNEATLDVRFALSALEPMSEETYVRIDKQLNQPVMFKSYGEIEATFAVMPIR